MTMTMTLEAEVGETEEVEGAIKQEVEGEEVEALLLPEEQEVEEVELLLPGDLLREDRIAMRQVSEHAEKRYSHRFESDLVSLIFSIHQMTTTTEVLDQEAEEQEPQLTEEQQFDLPGTTRIRTSTDLQTVLVESKPLKELSPKKVQI